MDQALRNWALPSMTEAAARYFYEDLATGGFFMFTLGMAERIAGVPRDEENIVQRHESQQRITTKTLLQAYDRLIGQMFINRQVDNFLSYLSEILGLIFRARPELLFSLEIKVEEVFQYADRAELVNALADRRVHSLSQKGMRELASYFAKQGLTLFNTEDDLGRAIFINEVRNLITHRRGVIDHKFTQKAPQYAGKEGHPLPVTEDVLEHTGLLTTFVQDIDRRVAQKFGLPQPVSRETLVASIEPLITAQQQALNITAQKPSP